MDNASSRSRDCWHIGYSHLGTVFRRFNIPKIRRSLLEIWNRTWTNDRGSGHTSSCNLGEVFEWLVFARAFLSKWKDALANPSRDLVRSRIFYSRFLAFSLFIINP